MRLNKLLPSMFSIALLTGSQVCIAETASLNELANTGYSIPGIPIQSFNKAVKNASHLPTNRPKNTPLTEFLVNKTTEPLNISSKANIQNSAQPIKKTSSAKKTDAKDIIQPDHKEKEGMRAVTRKLFSNILVPAQASEDKTASKKKAPQKQNAQTIKKTKPNLIASMMAQPKQFAKPDIKNEVQNIPNEIKKDSAMKRSHLKKYRRSFQTLTTMSVRSGVNKIIKVSRGHLNRIVTPFNIAVVKTVSSAQIRTEKGIVYVTPESDGNIITMFIVERGDPTTAISLSLIPSAIPPREIRLSINGIKRSPIKNMAARWEADPYIRNIKKTMKLIAHGGVPQGYAFRKAEKDDYKIFCNALKQNTSVSTDQIIDGDKILYAIGVVKNLAESPIEFDETECYKPGVLAVSIWPTSYLKPGEQTEIYVATQKKRKHHGSRHQRPSLISTGI